MPVEQRADGSMNFFFDRWGVIEATHTDKSRDPEGDAIEVFELRAKQRTLEEASKEVADLGVTLATAPVVAASAGAGAEPAGVKS